jgi:hypothetical protein
MTTINAVAIAIIVLLVGGAIYLWRFLLQKGVRRVVAQFREKGATDVKKAKTLTELGLVRPGMLGRAFRPRDYRYQALRMLADERVIMKTDQERFFLSEDGLRVSRLKRFAKID